MDLHTILTCAGFVLGTALLTFAVYFGSRLILGREFDSHTRDLAGSVIARVAALHGLILALVFAQEIDDYHALRDAMGREATAVADIFNDIDRYGTPASGAVQGQLARYVDTVIHPEWESLAQTERLADEGWALRETVYQTLLDLVPETPRQVSLRDHMIDRAQDIASLRQQREDAAMSRMSGVFWLVALSGVVFVTVPYFVFPPTRLNMSLLIAYSAYTGLIMFTIYAFSNPFANPGRLDPGAFERLLETDIGAAATASG
ncbi:hypothetical protein MLD63_15120 [Paracoccus sp. TK19116]|uniref:DUF4239 domain-containing protein n=1 Tax=Paracoccus albicereus TaxID=2922394 RepID=A0ABT1MUE8_9RHOB|nr:hypothetical protein [Paracoccus albicereus]MCQ0971754.1 hypothetical protein [Paracoccus albicereus]